MKLSVIIVNYNVKYFLSHCLASVFAALCDIPAEVIVVDNCSSDGSLDYLQVKYPRVKFINNTKNTGFAHANNLALAQATGKYVLYLNPDTLVGENTFKDCISFFEAHPKAGAIGVKMVDGSGKFLPESKRAFPSPEVSFYKMVGLAAVFPRSKKFSKYSLGNLDKNTIHEVEVLAGAFLMARADLLRRVNGFDERYFMYGEDIDLSFCLQQTGFQNYYLGNISIVHFKGESTQKGDIKQIKNFYRAMILFVDKHYRGSPGLIYRSFLKTAILGHSFLTLLKQPFIRLKLARTAQCPSKEIRLIGDPASAQQAKTIYEMYHPDTAISLCGAPVPEGTEYALVFCIGQVFTYDQAINFLEKNGPVQKVYWYYPDSESLISSSNKNGMGEVLSI